MTGFFDSCLSALEGLGAGAGIEGSADAAASRPQAQAFLASIGYLSSDGRADEALEPGELANRRALLSLAGRFEQLFELPLRHAPGVHFFGGRVSPTAFGLERHAATTLNPAGRGLSRRQAFESCLGEAAEQLSFLEWPEDDEDDRRCPLSPTSNRDLLDWSLAGIGLESRTAAEEIHWLTVEALVGRRSAQFPMELCLRRPTAAAAGRRPAESNGCCAAPSIEQATLGGLYEVIERDAIALWWFGGAQAARLSEGYLREAGITALMSTLRPETSRTHWFLDLMTDLGVPAVAALSSEPDGQAVVAGFSAGPRTREAAVRAALELCQMELAQDLAVRGARDRDEDELNPKQRMWLERSRSLTLARHPRLKPEQQCTPTGDDRNPDEPLAVLCDRLSRAGHTPYRLDLTRKAIGIPVVRVLVPGLQSSRHDWTSKRLRQSAHRNAMDPGNWQEIPSPI